MAEHGAIIESAGGVAASRLTASYARCALTNSQTMQTLRYAWRDGGADHDLHLAPVEGTSGKPFLFGTGPNRQRIEIRDFHIMTTAVTQALWTHVMGSNPAEHEGARRPVENVSWNHITAPGGFLDRDQRVASRMAPGDPFEATKGHPHA